MKVALVASSYLPERGRLERRVDELARGLVKRGAEVEILTQGPVQLVPDHHESVIIRRFSTAAGPLRFPAAPRLREALRAAVPPFDVIDVHTRQLSLAVAVTSARVHRLVLTPSVPADTLANWRHAGATRAVVGAAVEIVCPSEFERDAVLRIVPDANRRTHVLPDGVDVAALRAAKSFDHDDIVVLAVDRLDHATGVGRAIAAMPSLDPEFRLVVVGDGPSRARLSAFAADLRISSRVRFVGSVPDELLFRWLRTARVVVALPADGGSGTLVTEARVAGVAVVASDLPIHRLAAGRPGLGPIVFVAPRASPLDVADAIEAAARLPTSSGAALLPFSTSSWESVVDSTWRLYRRVVGDPVDFERAGSEVVDLTAQLRPGRESRVEPVISGAQQSGAEQHDGRLWRQSRRRFENRMNGARRWP